MYRYGSFANLILFFWNRKIYFSVHFLCFGTKKLLSLCSSTPPPLPLKEHHMTAKTDRAHPCP